MTSSAGVVVVCAAEHPLVGRRRSARVRETDVGVQLDDVAGRVVLVVRVVELVRRRQRRTAVAPATDHVLLLVQIDAIPELDEHPDHAHDVIAAAVDPVRSRPARPRPDEARPSPRRPGRRVCRAVLEAHQVARRAGRPRRRDEPVLAPAHLHPAAGGAGDLAHRVGDGVRVVGADLQQQVAVAHLAAQRVVREVLHRAQPGRLGGGQAVAVVEQRGPDRERHGEAVGDHRRARGRRSRAAAR